MNTYGLNEHDLINVREKVKNQRDYLMNNEIVTSNGQFKKLIDLSFSANHSYRYYAQLANKINTMEGLAINKGLVPLFITMTLDGFYRDIHKGNYTRFDSFSIEKQNRILKSVPNDETRGFIRDKMLNREPLSVKELYNVLNHQMRTFRASYAFKSLKSAKKEYMYIKTVEPHKDGVPHFHMMLFIPHSFIETFRASFIRSFPAPRNSHPDSFQVEINSASAYIMKYITKSFMDVKNQKEPDYLSAWFIKNRIMRCVTSRTLLPQWVYKIASIFEKDWYYLTDILNSPNNHSEWSKDHNCFWIYDNWSMREICFEYGRLSVYSKGVLVKQVGTPVQTKYKSVSYEKIPKKWFKKNKEIPIILNGSLTFFYHNGKFKKFNKHITELSHLELVEKYENYNIDKDSYIHYLAIRNLLIDKGLLSQEKVNLSSFDLDKFLFY